MGSDRAAAAPSPVDRPAAGAATWVFGYGSLLWRPSFPFEERATGWVEGWVRRFWQGSTDHRGVPSAPGRVVTLVREAGARCAGVAYRLPAAQAEAILRHLDHREKGGYARHAVTVHVGGDRPSLEALVYVATETNPEYLGPAPLEALVAQIRAARGPSGHNTEYVRRLAGALTELGAPDEHVDALARALDTGADGEG